jgi:histidyl-tRNA synthetase
VPFGEEQVQEALRVSGIIRKQGLKVDTYLEDKKIAKKFEYADKLNIPTCIVIGEKEVNNKNKKNPDGVGLIDLILLKFLDGLYKGNLNGKF